MSFTVPSSRALTPMATIGGSWVSTLKKLYGAALTFPFGLSVVTKAIGRGTTTLTSSL